MFMLMLGGLFTLVYECQFYKLWAGTVLVVKVLYRAITCSSTWFGTCSKEMVEAYKLIRKTHKGTHLFLITLILDNVELRQGLLGPVTFLVFKLGDFLEDEADISEAEKLKHLRRGTQYLVNGPTSDFTDIRPTAPTKDSILIKEFGTISAAFKSLPKDCQDLLIKFISDLTSAMTKLARYDKKTEDYYIEYMTNVIFPCACFAYTAARKNNLLLLDEDDEMALHKYIYNTAIFFDMADDIKDYYVDVAKGNCRWPSDIWSKHVDKIEDLKKPANEAKALECINELIIFNLQYLPTTIKTVCKAATWEAVFGSGLMVWHCVLSITDAYNNIKIFTGNRVHLNKLFFIKAIMQLHNIESFKSLLTEPLLELKNKLVQHPCCRTKEGLKLINECLELCGAPI